MTLALPALAVVLGFTLVRPRGWPEAVAAVPAAAVLIVFGVTSLEDAVAEMNRLLPVVGFLAAILVLAKLCDDNGLFHAAGVVMARVSQGDPRRLLAIVFIIAAATTAILSLDATAVLLAPVVLATARALSIPARPHAYAVAHLANSASLLLPVSNLTNLLVFTASGLSFAEFTAFMTLPWLAAVGVEFLLLRQLFARELATRPAPTTATPPPEVPIFVLALLAMTLVGFVVTSLIGLSPAWAALAGAVALGVRSLAQHRSTIGGLVHAVNVPFLAFVLALGVIVDAIMRHGLDEAMADMLPAGDTLPALLAIAAIAAVLCNVVNNLPAVLVLLPLVASSGPAAMLAVLIGVNIGPNLTYVGSLANLLWRRVVQQRGCDIGFGEFSRIGVCTVPLTLLASVAALWVGTTLIG